MKCGGITISASAPGGLGGPAVVHGEIGAGGAGVDHHRHAAGHLVDDDARVTSVALGLVELEDLAAQRDAEAMHARPRC